MTTPPEAPSPPDSSVPVGESQAGSRDASDGGEDIATFDRPMRDAPAPRRWMPVLIVALGICGVGWGASMALGGPQAPQRLAAPVEEIEYTTGIVSDLPEPRPAPALPPARSDGVFTSAARSDASDDAAMHDAAQKLADARRHAPVMLLSGERQGRALDNALPSGAALAAHAESEDTFQRSPSIVNAGVVRATRAATRPDVTLLQGAFIPATLETAIQSDLPGSIRAVVGRDVYAADATRLLIPRGSRLVGAYRSGLVRGQSRVFAVWTRLIRPDGVSIALDAPVTDGAGRAGIGGARDSHFFERFGSAVLLSLIDGGIVAAANNAGTGDEARVVLQSGRDFSRAAEIALQNSIDIPPTVHVAPGTRLQVFVNRDIDFSGVVAQSMFTTDVSP